MRTQLQRMFARGREPERGLPARLRTRLAAALLLGAAALGGSTGARAQATITYLSAGNIVGGYSTGSSDVRLTFGTACPGGTQVRIDLPAGVTYGGSVSKIGGAAALGIAYNAGASTPSQPVFDITGTISASDILDFRFSRRAGCTSTQGGDAFDAVHVINGGGCNASLTNPMDPTHSMTYNIYHPTTPVTPAPSVTNAVIGTSPTTATRVTQVTNGGGFSSIDRLHFYIVYRDGAVVNTNSNRITVGGTDFAPVRTGVDPLGGGDTLFYEITGAVFPAGGTGGASALDNGEAVNISEPIRVVKCGTLANATVYGAGWGTPCFWQTGSSVVTMANGAASLTVAEQNLVQGGNFCNNAIVEVVLQNNGSETVTGAGIARNITQYIGQHNGDNLGIGGGVRPNQTLTNFQIKDGASWVSLTHTGGGTLPPTSSGSQPSAQIAFSQLTTAPGTGYGLIDADGDGIYNDLPVGATCTLRYEVVRLQRAACSTQNHSGTMYYQATYSSMCGTAATSNQLVGYSAATGNGRIIPSEDRAYGSATYPVTAPPDIIDGQVGTIRIQGAKDFQTNDFPFTYPTDIARSLYTCPTNRVSLRISLPKGMTLNIPGMGDPDAGRFYEDHTTGIVSGTSSVTTDYTDPTYNYVTISGSKARYYSGFSFEADVTLSCAAFTAAYGGGAPVPAITYEVIYTCDNSASCGEEVWACGTVPMTPHCGICSDGGLTARSTSIQRTTGGYVSTTSNAWVDLSNPTFTAAQKRVMTAGDSALGTFTGKLINGDAAPFNGHYFRMQYTAPGGNKAMEIYEAELNVYDGTTGLLKPGSPYTIAAPASSAISGTLHIMAYDLSSYGIAMGDSIVLSPRFVMLENPGIINVPSMLPGMRVEFYSTNTITPAAEYTCDGFSLEMYLHRTSYSLSLGTGDILNTNGCVTYAILGDITTTPMTSDVYPGELRTLYLIDSVKIEINNGDFFSGGFRIIPGGITTSEGPFTTHNVPFAAPSYSTAANNRVYVNDGTWPKGEWNLQGIAYNFRHDFTNGCSSMPLGDIRYTVYGRRNTTAHSSSFHVVEGSTVTKNVQNGSMPTLSVDNNTGIAQGIATTQYWDITINNTTNVNAPNVWFALEKGTSGITIDRVHHRSGSVEGALVTPAGTYGPGGENVWYQASPANIANTGTSQQYRVYFSYSNCAPDNIRLITGWNCAGLPSPDPSAFACTPVSIMLPVQPQPSEVQVSTVLHPGQDPTDPGAPFSTIDLCNGDSTVILVTSANAANLVNPYVLFTAPPGVTVPATLTVQYPHNTGTYENVAVTEPTPGVYRLDLNGHSAIAAAGGLLGTVLAGGDNNLREARIKFDFNTGCGFPSGTAFRFYAHGNRSCGTGVAATNDGASTTTASVNITGASVTGSALVNLSFSGAVTAVSCGSPVTLESVIRPFGADADPLTDTVVYTIPAGMAYVPGSLLPGTLTAVVSGNTVKIGMPATTDGTDINLSFQLAASGAGCSNAIIDAGYHRQIASLTCDNGIDPPTTCSNSSMVLRTATSPTLTINKPSLHIVRMEKLDASAEWAMGPFYENIVKVVYENNGTQAYTAGVDTIEFYCNTGATTPFYKAALSKNLAVSAIDSDTYSIYMPLGTCTVGDFVEVRIPTTTAAGTPQCLCAGDALLAAAPLPLHLLSFNAAKKGNTAQLAWATATEQGSKGFAVERSTDGSTWSSIGFVNSKAQNGNSSTRLDYAYTDSKPATGKNYYRLALTGKDGKVSYSPVRTLSFGTLGSDVSIYPNPATDKIRIDGLDGISTIHIMDATGRKLISATVTESSTELSLSHLADGIYQVHITDASGNSSTYKLVKSK